MKRTMGTILGLIGMMGCGHSPATVGKSCMPRPSMGVYSTHFESPDGSCGTLPGDGITDLAMPDGCVRGTTMQTSACSFKQTIDCGGGQGTETDTALDPMWLTWTSSISLPGCNLLITFRKQ